MSVFTSTKAQISQGPFRCLVLVVVCLLTLSTPAESADTDSVVLRNGDRLVGELKELRQGKLKFDTGAMSVVYIKWDRVAQLTAPHYFEVELVDGTRYYGMLQPGSAGRAAVVLSGRVQEVDLASIVGIRPIKLSFWSRLDGSVSLGASYTQSSGTGQGTLYADVAARWPTYEVSMKLNTTITVQDKESDSARATLSFGYARFLARRWFIPLVGKLERNQDLGFKLRSSVGTGLGLDLVQTNRSSLSAVAGIQINREAPVSGENTTNAVGYFATDYSFFTYDSPKTNVGVSLEVLPNLSDFGRVRVDFSGSLSREVLKDLTIGFTVFNSYDSRPPTAEAHKNDIGFSLNVGWSF